MSDLILPGIFVVAAKQTPFGAFGGKLKDLSQTDLCEVAAKAALAAGNINPEIVDSTFVGNVAQVCSGAQISTSLSGLVD